MARLHESLIWASGCFTATDEVVERKRFGPELRAYLAKPGECAGRCGSAQSRGRVAQGLGHTVRLMSPQFVLPYVKSNKNDVNRPSRGGGPSLDASQEHLQQLQVGGQGPPHGHGFGWNGVALPKGLNAMLQRLEAVLEDGENECRFKAGRWYRMAEELKRLHERVQAFDARIEAIGLRRRRAGRRSPALGR